MPSQTQDIYSKITLKRSVKGWIFDMFRCCFELFLKEKNTSYLVKKFNSQAPLEIQETLTLLKRSFHRHLYVVEGKKALNRRKSTMALFQSFTDKINSELKTQIKEEKDLIQEHLSKELSATQAELQSLQKELEKAHKDNSQISFEYQDKLKDSFSKIESLAKEMTELKAEKQKPLETKTIDPSSENIDTSALKKENAKLKEQLLDKQNEVTVVAQKANEQLTKLSQALVEKSKELEEAQTALITQINKLYKLTEDLKLMVRSKETEIGKLGENLSNVLSYLHKYHPDLAQKIEDLYEIL